MLFNKNRKTTVAALLAIALVGVVTPAMAEGTWTSYMTGVLPGFETRNFTDNNSDATATTSQHTSCSTNGPTYFSHTLRLNKRNGIWPATNKGDRSGNCSTFNWGRQTEAGVYYMTVVKVNNYSSKADGIRLNVGIHTVTY